LATRSASATRAGTVVRGFMCLKLFLSMGCFNPVVVRSTCLDRNLRATANDQMSYSRIRLPHYLLEERLAFFLVFAHRACAAFLANSFLSSAVRAAMRFLPPLPPAALPPFLPISRMTSEMRFRRMALFYEQRPNNGQSAPLTPEHRFEKLLCN
jgi:hypothetical protein